MIAVNNKTRRIWICSIVLPLFFSCTTLSPVSNEMEKSPGPGRNIGEVFPAWEPLGGEDSGLAFYAGRTKEPRIEFWALRAALENPRIGIIVNNGTLSTHVTSFTEEYNCAAGINTNPFDPVSGREGEKRTVIGIAVSEGVSLSPSNPGYSALVFYGEGGAAILSQAEINETSRIKNAVGGFGVVLEAGRVSSRLLEEDGELMRPRRNLDKHPRSAAGLSEDGKTLYLLVVDGRRIRSEGVTEAELALLLKRLGAYSGLNFDGGGSSVLALRFPDGKVRAVNTPIHNMIPGLQRGVATCLGIVLSED